MGLPSYPIKIWGKSVQGFLSYDRTNKQTSWQTERNWVIATNSNFLIPISLQLDGVTLWYFIFRLFDLTDVIINLKYLRSTTLLVAKIEGLENQSKASIPLKIRPTLDRKRPFAPKRLIWGICYLIYVCRLHRGANVTCFCKIFYS